jgi:glycosyltransferase involved in cell wall biosynthesis
MAANALSRDHEVFVAYCSDVYGQRFEQPKIKLPFFFELDPVSIVKLVAFIQKNHIDVLLPTKRKDYVLAGIAAKLTGAVNVLRLGIVRELKPTVVNQLVYQKLAKGIIVNALEIKQVLQKTPFMARQEIQVIYNGLDIDDLNTKSLAETYEKPFKFVVSSMGSLIKRKGFDFLLNGFAEFMSLSGATDAGLVIIGDGPELETLNEQASQLGLSDKVVFTGFLENPYPCLAASDVFAMVSQNEGFANALLEAVALGNAPISTTAGGVEEILTHEKNVLIVPYNDTNALAGHIHDLYLNQQKREFLQTQAREVVADVFSLKRMKNELEDFFQHLIDKKEQA